MMIRKLILRVICAGLCTLMLSGLAFGAADTASIKAEIAKLRKEGKDKRGGTGQAPLVEIKE